MVFRPATAHIPFRRRADSAVGVADGVVGGAAGAAAS